MGYVKGSRERRLSPVQEHAAERLQHARQAVVQHKITLRREIERQLAERGEVFENAIVEAVQRCVELGMSKAAIMRAYGTSDYRTVQNYIDRVRERLTVADVIAPARFTFAGVDERGEILVHDTVDMSDGRLYIGEWKGDWEHNLYGARFGKLWESIPELERLVSDVESGSFVPEADVARLDAAVRARIDGSIVEVADGLSFD